MALAAVGCSVYLLYGGVIGAEFLPHLDEGSIWAFGNAAPSIGPDEGTWVVNRARIAMASFPEVKQVVSRVGRPDDGMDTAGFDSTEYFVDLKPKEQWRPVFEQDKDQLIAAMSRQLEKIPGVLWHFTQPIADEMEEAETGIKGQLAVKIYGEDLKILEEKGAQVVRVMRSIPGVDDLGMLRVTGQPNLNLTVDRDAAARFQINVADAQDAIQTAVGGNAVTQVLQGEQRYDLVARYLPSYRDTREAIGNIRLLSPSGERVSLAQLCKIRVTDGASMLYREANSRLCRDQVQRARPRPRRHRGRSHSQSRRAGEAAASLQLRMGGRVRKSKTLRGSADDHSAPDGLSHLPDHLWRVWFRQVGLPAPGQHRRGACRRSAGAVHHRHPLQRIVGRGLPGSVRRFGSDWRDHGGIHQSVARARTFHRKRRD